MANTNEHSKRASATKSGPGRYHSDDHSKATPIPPRGSARMVLHKASQTKRDRRALVKQFGRRQVIKLEKLFRADERGAADINAPRELQPA
jgi:hypothetical protein